MKFMVWFVITNPIENLVNPNTIKSQKEKYMSKMETFGKNINDAHDKISQKMGTIKQRYG